MDSGIKKAGIKTVSLVLAAAAILFCFASCGKGSGKTGKEIYDGLSAQVSEKMKFAEELAPIDKKTACLTYGIEEEKIAEAAVYVGSGAYVDEFALLLGVDGVKTEDLKAAAQLRIDSQKKLYRSYRAEEVPKLDNALVYTKDNLVVVLVGGDEATAALVKEAFN